MKDKLQKLALASTTAVASFPLLGNMTLAADQDGSGGAIGERIQPPDAFFTDIGSLINSALQFVLVIAALLVFMYLIWGGIEWITSGGDKGKTESARNKITAAVIGLIVVAASYAILQLALTFLGAGDLSTLVQDLGNN